MTALRQLRKSPGFTAVAVLTLAIGIGANTFVFSFVNQWYFRPLDFPQPEQLVEISIAEKEGDLMQLTPAQFLQFRDQTRTMRQVAAIHRSGFNITGVNEPESLQGARVTAGLFHLLQVRPALGRNFHPSEDEPGAEDVVIIGHGTWQRHFGGKTDVIGRTIQLNLKPHVVIGVVPPEFNLPIVAGNADVWVTTSSMCRLKTRRRWR